MSEDIEYLKRKNAHNVSAYEQIGNFLLKLFLERPPQERIYHEFEAEASELATSKQSTSAPRLVTTDERLLAQYLYSFYKTFKKPSSEEEEEQEQEPEPEEDPAEYPDIPDLVALGARLRSVGVSLSAHDATQLQMALRRLASTEDRSGDKITLFGKVGCYWVFKAQTDSYIEPEAEEEEEFEVPEEEVVEEEPLEDVPEEELEENEAGEGEDKDEAEDKEEKGEAELEEGEGKDDAKEEDDDLDGKKEEQEAREGEDAGEGEEEFDPKSDESLEEEFSVPTKVPKRVPYYRGRPFALKKTSKLPVEEHEGVNKDLFFVATDFELSHVAAQVALEILEEQRQKEYRKANRLQQRKTFIPRLLRALYERPLSFVPLPEITPEQMRVAKCLPPPFIRFTGDLTRDAGTSLPRFEGTEGHLLHCILARIQHECTIVPENLYAAEEPEAEPDENLLTELEKQARIIQLRRERRTLTLTQGLYLYEILLHFPSLAMRTEDEEPENTEAVYAELNEEFQGFGDLRMLLNPEKWRYLLPRISGQGRVQPLSWEDYEGIDEPEPWEIDVALTLKARRKEERERAKQEKKEQKERELEELRERLGERRFQKYLKKREEEGEEEVEEEDPSDPEDLHIEPDDYEEEELEAPDAEEGTYDEWCKYYMYRLWTKLRVFRRPVCPWDVPLLDNKTNIGLPRLFQPVDAEDRTRVDFKSPLKCRYSLDENSLENNLAVSKTHIKKWQFSICDDPLNGDRFLTATSVRWPGSMNLLYGARGKQHTLVYFGDGISLEDATISDIALPDMCDLPYDVLEEPELPVEEQRRMYAEEQEKKRLKREREEAERRAAEEAEEKEEDE